MTANPAKFHSEHGIIVRRKKQTSIHNLVDQKRWSESCLINNTNRCQCAIQTFTFMYILFRATEVCMTCNGYRKLAKAATCWHGRQNKAMSYKTPANERPIETNLKIVLSIGWSDVGIESMMMTTTNRSDTMVYVLFQCATLCCCRWCSRVQPFALRLPPMWAWAPPNHGFWSGTTPTPTKEWYGE